MLHAGPSPVLSQIRSPFLSRSLNRTGSQSSSGTTRSATPPSIPPLDLRPPFPGPHPSASYDEIPPLRPRLGNLPTIEGSVEDYIGSEASLHADSFFTASDSLHEKEDEDDIADGDNYEPEPVRLIRPLPRRQPVLTHVEVPKGGGLVEFPSMEDIPLRSPRARRSPSPPSVSESFIARRWDRAADIPPITFPPKPQPSRFTPAFWAFWLGFIFPILWLVGGWHFTTFGEQPPKMSLAEFYFNLGYLKAVYCCLYRKRREWAGSGGKGKTKGKKDLVLPRWVDEKREYYDEVARLNDRKGSMRRRGFLFGYPFVPRPFPPLRPNSGIVMHIMTTALHLPLTMFDQLYGVKLVQVKGRKETGRRMFDPWIQRCRYALCFALIVTLLGTITAATYLLVVNIRGL